MHYYPIRDPIDDLRVVPVDRWWFDLVFFFGAQQRGRLRISHEELAPMLLLLCGTKPVAASDLFEGSTNWFADYIKDHVVDEDGSIIHVGDLP